MAAAKKKGKSSKEWSFTEVTLLIELWEHTLWLLFLMFSRRWMRRRAATAMIAAEARHTCFLFFIVLSKMAGLIIDFPPNFFIFGQTPAKLTPNKFAKSLPLVS